MTDLMGFSSDQYRSLTHGSTRGHGGRFRKTGSAEGESEVLPLFLELGDRDLAESFGVGLAEPRAPVQRLEVELETARVLAVVEVPEEVDDAPRLGIVDRDHLRVVELRL